MGTTGSVRMLRKRPQNPFHGRLDMTASSEKLNESDITARLFELITKMSDDEQQSLLKDIEERLFIRKREFDRRSYFSVVDYHAKEETFTDFIQNIGAGGVFIATSRSFSAGQEVLLAFPLPISQEHTTIPGEVVWVDRQGIGVKFKTIDHELEAKIKRVVDMMD